MEKNLENLLHKRKDLFCRMEELGDLRWGSISETYRKCGKQNCACAEKKHPGHIQYLWTTRKQGKTVAKGIRLGPELDQFQKQVEEGAQFQKLCDDIWDVSEEICRLRPVPAVEDEKDLDELKKKLQRKFSWKRRRRSNG
jgi:hypothetical protein